jgi:transcriptional regulator with XRE-family HTH domain
MKRGRPKGKSSDKRSFGPLGDLIRKKRLERNLGLLDVAKAVKCSVQFISNIEHGRAPLPWDKAERLSSYLELPMDELQAANLSIRADFKSFMATARWKKIPKSSFYL